MATMIRMQRAGARNHPTYRIVVTDSRNPRDGRFIEKVGFYNPRSNPVLINIDEERVSHWMGHGAKCSESVASLLKRQQEGKLGELTGVPKAKERKRAAKAATAQAAAKAEAAASEGDSAESGE